MGRQRAEDISPLPLCGGIWCLSIFLLFLSSSALAHEIVLFKDGAETAGLRGLQLRVEGDWAFVAMPRLKRSSNDAGIPAGSEVPLTSLQGTGQQAESVAILCDPSPPTNLRVTPGGKVLQLLDSREILLVLQRGKWHHVMTPRGVTGYVHESVVSVLTLQADRAVVDAIVEPLAREHVAYCAAGSDPRRRSCLSIFLGPLGSVIIAPDGHVVKRERPAWCLAGGLFEDSQWAAAHLNLVDPPRYASDGGADTCVLRRGADGRYHEVHKAGPELKLEMLHKVGVPDKVIRGLCLPVRFKTEK